MRKLPKDRPKYRRHKHSGRAVVTLNGRDIYLGRWGSPESREKYDRITGEWLANGRRLPEAPTPEAITVGRLAADYLDHTKASYGSREWLNIRDALRPVLRLYRTAPVSEFTPLALKAVRNEMVASGLARSTVNARIGRIKRMVKWGVGEGAVAPAVYQALQAVEGLRIGRTEAKETEPVRPVERSDVDAILPHLRPPVRALVELAWWTGARMGELVLLRTGDLDRTGSVWLYRPRQHKTAHHGHRREVPLGPRAQEVLRPWLRADPEAFVFNPREDLERHRAERRAARQTPMTPSQARRRRRRKPKRQAGEHYTPGSVCRAVTRACARAGIAPWHPHQLRHAAATRLRREHGIEVARIVLGHRSVDVTSIYAEADRARAVSAMESAG